MKKKLWAVLVAFVALTVFATSAFAAVRWRNVASIYPGISAGDNSYTCEISCLSGTTKIDCTLVLYEKGLFGTYSEVSRSSSTYYGHTHEFSGTANIKSRYPLTALPARWYILAHVRVGTREDKCREMLAAHLLA